MILAENSQSFANKWQSEQSSPYALIATEWASIMEEYMAVGTPLEKVWKHAYHQAATIFHELSHYQIVATIQLLCKYWYERENLRKLNNENVLSFMPEEKAAKMRPNIGDALLVGTPEEFPCGMMALH